MKIKGDFVTNSSSTSFILRVTAETQDLTEFVAKFNAYLQDYVENNSWRDGFEPPQRLTKEVVKKVGDNVFAIKDFIAIYNDEEDIPAYFAEVLRRLDEHEGMREYGISKVSYEMRDRNAEQGEDD